jgi:hypothetical protein
MFGVSAGGHVQVVSVNTSDLAAGNATTPYHNDVKNFGLRPAVMHDSKAGDPMWLVTVATLTDGDAADTATAFSGTINWGNGTTSAASFTALGKGVFTVTGTQPTAYAEEGTPLISISVTDNDGGSASTSWTYAASLLSATGIGNPATVYGPDGRIYTIGGAIGGATPAVIPDVYAYTPGTNTWSNPATCPHCPSRAPTGPL